MPPEHGHASLPAGGLARLLRGLLADGVSVRMAVGGVSMAPAIRPGDTVLVAPVAAAALRMGDVVLAETGDGRLILHRLVRHRPAGRGEPRAVQTRGDAGWRLDAPVPLGDVLGRARRVERGARVVELDTPAARLRARLTVVLALGASWIAYRGNAVRRLLGHGSAPVRRAPAGAAGEVIGSRALSPRSARGTKGPARGGRSDRGRGSPPRVTG